MYYIEHGSVDLVRTLISGESLTLDRVGDRELIGEGAALPDVGSGGRHEHTAMAVTETTVLVINAEEVQKILTINPELHERLRVRYNSLKVREEEEADIQNRAEGVDQRIKLSDAITEDEYRATIGAKKIDKFPHVAQGDESDNPAACLTAIVQHYGKQFALGQLREITNLGVEGAAPNALITAAEILGLRAKAYGLNFEELKKAQLPVICGWEGYHWIVIFKIDGKNVYLTDPAAGLGSIPIDEFLEGWTTADVSGVEERDPDKGVVIGIDTTVEFTRLEPPSAPIYHFLAYILPHKKFFGEALLGAVTINLLGLASPLFVQAIVDNVVVHKDVGLLNLMLAGMALVTIFTVISRGAQSLLLAYTTARIDMKLLAEFYRHILSLPMSFFLSRNKGEIVARFDENETIRDIIAGSTVSTIMDTLMIIIYLSMMLAYNPFLTALAMMFIPLYLVILWYFVPKIKEIENQQFIVGTQAQSYLIESLNGIEALKATSNEYMARSRWENEMVESVNLGFRSQKLDLFSSTLYEMVELSSQILLLWVGASAVINGTMTIGELMGFNMLLGMVMGPILGMLQLVNDIQEVRISMERVSDVLVVDPEQILMQPDRMPAILTNTRGHIVFEDVDFSYVANGAENAIMRHFNLEIDPGMRIAFVGPSGCGKSTIAKMILGFNMPEDGFCKIDGKDIKTLELDSLRRNIGVVLQDSFLFGGTVAQNIALGDPQPDMQAVKEAARLAGADEFIINYPLGYNTLVGEKGIGVSGGQRQRICIARALYHKPRIMIFDEATSALDNESEARIMENMQSIQAGRTTISIAHRLSTIMDSDKICYIADGQVREHGTHRELIDKKYLKANEFPGRYYSMARTQFDLPELDLGLPPPDADVAPPEQPAHT